jgi:hypothetical protein
LTASHETVDQALKKKYQVFVKCTFKREWHFMPTSVGRALNELFRLISPWSGVQISPSALKTINFGGLFFSPILLPV